MQRNFETMAKVIMNPGQKININAAPIDEFFYRGHNVQILSAPCWEGDTQGHKFSINKGDKHLYTEEGSRPFEEAKSVAVQWLNERLSTKYDIAAARFSDVSTPNHPVRNFFHGCDKKYTYELCSRSDLREYLTGLVAEYPNRGWEDLLNSLNNDDPFYFKFYEF